MAKNFFASCMASEDIRPLLYTGVFYDKANKVAEIHDGALVVRGDMLESDVYTNVKDPNKYKITAPAAATDEVHIVDYVGRSQGDIMGVVYREGIKTFGLVCPAGMTTRVRIPQKYDSGYFAADNFVSAPTVSKFAIPTKDDTRWTPVDSIDTAKTCIKIEFEKDTVLGQVNDGKEYFVNFVNIVD